MDFATALREFVTFLLFLLPLVLWAAWCLFCVNWKKTWPILTQGAWTGVVLLIVIAEAVDIPNVLYNIPGRTGSNILPETIARLAEFPQIVAVKEATGSLDQASHIASLCNLTLLSGDDSLTLPLMSIGARGVVSVVGNIVPRDMKALVTAYDAGRLGEALQWHRKLFPLCRDLLSVATNPIPVKAAIKLLDRGNGEMRLPMCPLDAAGEERVRLTLKNYGLLR